MRLPFFLDISPADPELEEGTDAADRAKHGIDLGQTEKSFPIASVSDLKNAIHAIGRAKPGDRAKVKAHIISAAKKLGASDLIPDNWKESSVGVHAIDASEAMTHTKMSGKQLQQHVVDAHYCDADLATDATDDSLKKYHGKQHGESMKTEPFTASTREVVELDSGIIPLAEKAMAADDTVLLKLIQPGWGSSGYYPKSVLERDGPKVFPRGTMNFWDHPSATEEKDRPERSLRDLAATQVEDARYLEKGPAGEGLYARSKVFGGYKGAVEELAPYIGTSIRAMGRGEKGTAEGKDGTIINELVAARSVDFVTQAGAGGKVVALFESAGSRINKQEGDVSEGKDDKGDLALKEATDKLKEAESRASRAETAMLLREAKDIAISEVGKIALPDVVKDRIISEVSANPPFKDGKLDDAAFKTNIIEAVKSETEYLSKVTGAGRVRGMGPSTIEVTDKKAVETSTASLVESFRGLGMSESAAKAAAAGRN